MTANPPSPQIHHGGRGRSRESETNRLDQPGVVTQARPVGIARRGRGARAGHSDPERLGPNHDPPSWAPTESNGHSNAHNTRADDLGNWREPVLSGWGSSLTANQLYCNLDRGSRCAWWGGGGLTDEVLVILLPNHTMLEKRLASNGRGLPGGGGRRVRVGEVRHGGGVPTRLRSGPAWTQLWRVWRDQTTNSMHARCSESPRADGWRVRRIDAGRLGFKHCTS